MRMGNMEYIRKAYKVPAKRGMRVRAGAGKAGGRITGSRHRLVRVLLDRDEHTTLWHPLALEYLTEEAQP